MLLKIQSRHDNVRRADSDNVKPVYPPFNFVEAGDIINNSSALVQIMALH